MKITAINYRHDTSDGSRNWWNHFVEDVIVNSDKDDLTDVKSVNELIRRNLAEYGATVERSEDELALNFASDEDAVMFVLTWS